MVPEPHENAFLTGPILPPLIRFSMPLMLSLLLQGLYGAVDLAVVGRFASTASTAAVAVGSQMMVAVTARYGDSDGLNSPFEGDGGDRFGIYAKGYGVQRGKSIYSGMAGFSTGTRRNTQWTDVSDVWMLYPYLVGDIKGGDYIDESYRLSGSYSLYLGHHIVGLKVRYTGEMAHRGSDPRPKNTVSELVLNPGCPTVIRRPQLSASATVF